jgi:hypothetical protein
VQLSALCRCHQFYKLQGKVLAIALLLGIHQSSGRYLPPSSGGLGLGSQSRWYVWYALVRNRPLLTDGDPRADESGHADKVVRRSFLHTHPALATLKGQRKRAKGRGEREALARSSYTLPLLGNRVPGTQGFSYCWLWPIRTRTGTQTTRRANWKTAERKSLDSSQT